MNAPHHNSSHDHSPHGRTIGLVTLALFVLLAITVVLSLFDLGAIALPLALLIAAIKASVVAAYFMELRIATPVTRLAALAGLLFFGLLIAGTIADVLSRPAPTLLVRPEPPDATAPDRR